jgi:hypothetical protein
MLRRTFLQLLSLPALSLVYLPVAATPPPDPPTRAGLVYTDSDGHSDAALQALHDDDLHSGITYEA